MHRVGCPAADAFAAAVARADGPFASPLTAHSREDGNLSSSLRLGWRRDRGGERGGERGDSAERSIAGSVSHESHCKVLHQARTERKLRVWAAQEKVGRSSEPLQLDLHQGFGTRVARSFLRSRGDRSFRA
jgi:hypothetical protein